MTLADLAREAGTSASTASRALSGRGYVSADVRARLVAAAERLGYVPNASARTLKQRTSRVVGVVVSDLGNQFYGGLAAGIEQTLRNADYQMVLVADNSERPRGAAGARTFLAMRAPGVIMTPVGTRPRSCWRGTGVAVVEVDRQARDRPLRRGRDRQRARRAARRPRTCSSWATARIALLGVDTDWTSDAGRLAGYRAAHEAAGVPVDERLVVRIRCTRATPTRASARCSTSRLRRRSSPRTTCSPSTPGASCARAGSRSRGTSRSSASTTCPGWRWSSPRSPSSRSRRSSSAAAAAALLLRRLGEPGAPPAVERLQPTLVVRGLDRRPGGPSGSNKSAAA